MFGGGGERHAKRVRELADAALRERQAPQHCPPRRIGKSAKDGVKAVGSVFNHVVEYTPVRRIWSTIWLNN
jgi:hypothetical protein